MTKGIKQRKKAKTDTWMIEIAPPANFHKWFGHKKERWEEFKKRYFEELEYKNLWLKS